MPFLSNILMNNISSKPFSQEYVLRTTTKHVIKSIDISIRKTFERIEEFSGDHEKSQEIFKTLVLLNTMRRMVVDSQPKESNND